MPAGATLCHGHADDELHAARHYGRALGEMAVGDDLADELSATRPWPEVVDANRQRAILDERVRLLQQNV